MKINKSIIVRLLTGLLFVFSGSVKLFPALAFEMQLVAHGITNWLLVVVLARFIIAVEIFTGLVFLLNYNLKKYFIPFAFLLLSLFSVDLIITIMVRGFSGNCGCFGQVIQMTPLEALIKNIILLYLLFYFNKLETAGRDGNSLFQYAAFIIIFMLVFVISPVRFYRIDYGNQDSDNGKHNLSRQDYSTEKSVPIKTKNVVENENKLFADSAGQFPESKNEKIASLKKFISTPVIFSGNKKILLNDGIKILAVLNMECGSCLETARKLGKIKNETGFTEIYLLLYGSEQEVPGFFEKINYNFVYKVIDDKTFASIVPGSPPVIFLLKNGKLKSTWNFRTFNSDSVKNKLSNF